MKIALTFSGGGYRAAAFSLGTLSLLNKLSLDEHNLLEDVEILSTVSGGTITGLRYAASLKKGESFDTFYNELYSFLADTTLIEDALALLSDDDHWKDGRVRSLVSSFADVYDKELFKFARFRLLMDENNPKGIKHVSFNATEFSNALQFRFQWSEKMLKPAVGESERGVIGNAYYQLAPALASDIRLADIMAASSCFPGGFEPINFPSDFIWSAKASGLIPTGADYPFGLMDGGIVDNQGIEPVLLARDRMYRNHVSGGGDANELNQIDLVLISDVASPNMEDYKVSKEDKKGWWKGLSPRGIINFNWLLSLASIFGFGYFFYQESLIGMLAATAIFTVSLMLHLVFGVIGKLIAGAGIPEQFLEPLSALKRTKLYVYQSLLNNRKNSLLMLTMEVFLKHVRRMNYNSLYKDKNFVNRRIMSAVYELKSDEKGIAKKVASGALPKHLMPSDEMMQIADTASSMGTTLWFTPEEIKSKMLSSIIACGQFTACWNLLEYIELLKKDKNNTGDNHLKICALEPALLELWDEFKKNPLCLVN